MTPPNSSDIANLSQLVVNARFLTQPLTGVQRYGIELSREIKRANPNAIFVSPRNVLHEDIERELESNRVGKLTDAAWEQIDLPLYLRKHGSPFLLSLGSTAPAFYRNQAFSHHDITYIRYPSSFQWAFRLYYRLLTPIITRHSKFLITVSEFSKNEISTYYRAQPNRILVCHNAATPLSTPTTGSSRVNPPRPFALAVSSIAPHKNFDLLIDIFSEELSDIDLFVVGAFNPRLRAGHNRSDSSNIHFLGRLPDAELAHLYSRARIFVFPSLYEGFGIPAIEAQSFGVPVVCSNASALPEVLADSARYFDPTSRQDAINAIRETFISEDMRASLSEAGLRNAGRFSWSRSAQAILDEIQRLNQP